LNGAEIARSEWYLQGQLPLHTLRADIDYGFSEARTTYGAIGIKCWVYKGEAPADMFVRRGRNDEPRRNPRRDRRPPQAGAGAPPVAEPQGPAVQLPPTITVGAQQTMAPAAEAPAPPPAAEPQAE
jgi:small subunit ribosomal protein S3